MNAPPRSEADPLHPVGLRDVNRSDPAVAAALLRPCLDLDGWVASLVDGRPYASVDELFATARAAASPFTAAELEAALAHHLRIGERAGGRSAEATLSRSEQATLTHTRLATEPDTEDEVVADQLRQIALVRLAGVIST